MHAIDMVNGQTKVEDKTEQKGRSDGRKERRQEGSSMHIMHTEGKDSRSGKREGRRERGKKRRRADEAGKTSTELYQSFIPSCVSSIKLR